VGGAREPEAVEATCQQIHGYIDRYLRMSTDSYKDRQIDE
jgi:hypothetical protein